MYVKHSIKSPISLFSRPRIFPTFHAYKKKSLESSCIHSRNEAGIPSHSSQSHFGVPLRTPVPVLMTRTVTRVSDSHLEISEAHFSRSRGRIVLLWS
jgi:hypothetical protein